MRKLFTAMRNAPKRASAVFAMVVAATLIPTALLAWGPDRKTFTVDKPADYVTFNSITDNPHVGDERNFVVVKDAANTNAGGWKDEIDVQPGKEYLVRMYVHNNAAAELDLVAQNTRVKAHVPTTTGKSVQIDGFVSADNAKPKQVWDQAILKSGNDKDFNVAYVPGSAILYNNVFGQTGKKLSDNIVTSAGAPVGYNKLDGKVPGCFQFAGYVTFKVKPQFAKESDFTVSKQVRKHGDSEWKEKVDAKAGDKVDFLVAYKNTGESRQDNVHVSDKLPAGMDYVPGSTKIANPSNPGGVATSDGVTVGNGLNIGDYPAGSNAFLMFTAKVKSASELECGPHTMKNIARVTADGGYKEDDATVVVDNGDCPEPEEIRVCDLETNEVITISEDEFNPERHSKDLADCEFVEVCDPATGDIITVPSHERDDYLPVDSKKCKDAPVTPDTPKTPEMPPELPQTGPAEAIVSIASLGALIASSYYYVVSRRAIQ